MRNVTSWYDFAKIFSDHEVFLQNLPLPPSSSLRSSRLWSTLSERRFSLRFAEGVRRESGSSPSKSGTLKTPQSKRNRSQPFSSSHKKGVVGIDENLVTDVMSGEWHEVHQKIADALGAITDDEPAVLSVLKQAVSRTLGGGDAFFVCQELFGTSKLLVTPSHSESSGEIEICFFPNSIISVRTPSVFDIRSLNQMDGREMVEVHVTHVLNLCIGERRAGVSSCSVLRHLLIDSPDSQVASDVSDLMGL